MYVHIAYVVAETHVHIHVHVWLFFYLAYQNHNSQNGMFVHVLYMFVYVIAMIVMLAFEALLQPERRLFSVKIAITFSKVHLCFYKGFIQVRLSKRKVCTQYTH